MPATKRKRKTKAPSTESARTTEELEMEIFIIEKIVYRLNQKHIKLKVVKVKWIGLR
ncbi:hypothetical protein NLX67_21065 [Domibacillus sp. A3M-37]|uniref:hypothetical protein n=1 Tax=Domibacillus sp. A3M-37 TaxID=2962037 RepID=UPI0020B7F8C6|nr:hypothetical protein [Domibacillus sp. A3M-37]MCP3764815.1 hypothetical protein [Domibacillus sp. A3M-37]